MLAMLRRALSHLSRPVVCAKTSPATFRGYAHSSAARENHKLRVELAAAYRSMAHYNLQEGVDNHITALAPAADNSGRELMLLVPEGLHWSQVTPSCLLGLDEHNEIVEGEGGAEITAMCIHRGVRAKHNHLAVLHAHSPYITALSCLEDQTVRPIHQMNAIFDNRIAYDKEFGGFGIADEGARLGQALGDKEVLMMGGHGYVTCGPSIAIAFNRAYFLERVVMFQMIAMATGQPLREISPEVIKKAQKYIDAKENFYAQRHLNCFIRMFSKECSEFEEYDLTLKSE